MPEPANTRQLHILLVEDDPSSRRSLGRLLELSGFAVTAVGDGVSAIAELDRQQFDFLLTDLILPGLDGSDVVYHARTLNPRPVITVMTGATSTESQEALQEVVVDHVFYKPVSVAAVAQKLRELRRGKTA